jgi:hypothetical protein
MNQAPDPSAELERLVARALRDLPLRSAPGTLEIRVMAAIAQRAALPRWRLGFLHWPLAAQCVFLVTSIAFVKLGLSMWELLTSALPGVATEDLATGLSWMRTAADLAVSLDAAARGLSASIPQLWLYGGGATILALYALLFGLAALGLRVFQVNR